MYFYAMCTLFVSKIDLMLVKDNVFDVNAVCEKSSVAAALQLEEIYDKTLYICLKNSA